MTNFTDPKPGEFQSLLFWNDKVKKTARTEEFYNPNPEVFDIKKCALCGHETLVPKTFKGSKPECKICRGIEKPRHVNYKGGFPIGAIIHQK